MVLSLTVDELVQAHFDALVEEGRQKQVGLVVGRCGSKRDLVVALIPTPAVGGAEPVRLSKGSSNNATAVSVSVSADAVAEHARQTSMLLPGGLSVVGLFLFAPGGLSAAAGGESSLLSAWREAVRISDASGGCRLGGAGGGGGGGGVLLGADASSRGRVAAKEVVAPPGASSSSSSCSSSALSLRHAETRFAPLLPRLVSLRATYPVAAKVSVSTKEKKKKKKKKGGGQRAAPPPAPPPLLSDLLSAVAGAEAARARRCLALGSGTRLRPLDLDASVADSLGELGEPEAGAGGAREVVLLPPAVSCSLLPESDDDDDDDDGDDEGEGEGEGEQGFLRLEGWVEARALVHERDSVREAVEALALDVGATVRARVAAAVEEAQEEEEEEAEAGEGEEGVGGEARTRPPLLSPPPSSSPVVVPLARRVLFPLLPGGGGGSSAPAALVLGGDLALPPKRRRGNEQGGRNGGGVSGGGNGVGGNGVGGNGGGGGGGGVGGAEEEDRADGEGALDAAAQLCGRDDLVPEDLTFAEGRAEGASAAGVASSCSSPPSSSRREAAAGAAAAARAAPTTATRAPTAPSAAATATATASAVPVAAVGAVAAATLALALGAYLTLA